MVGHPRYCLYPCPLPVHPGALLLEGARRTNVASGQFRYPFTARP